MTKQIYTFPSYLSLIFLVSPKQIRYNNATLVQASVCYSETTMKIVFLLLIATIVL
jgi:hypothetical protein